MLHQREADCSIPVDMTDTPDPSSELEAAQEAAGAGDYEAAERGYRRAHAIAVKSLPPGHPFVAISLKNLVDFCVARGIPIWTPPQVKPGADASPRTAARPRRKAPVSPNVREDPASATRTITPRMIAMAALSVCLLVALVFTTLWRGSGDSSTPSPEAQRADPSSGSSAPPSSTTLSSTTPPPAATRELEPAAPPRETSGPQTSKGVELPQRPDTPTTSTPVTVLTAQLCSVLERRGAPDWQCTPAGESSRPGTFIFYTRLLTALDTTVEHRWYHRGRLHQIMRLRVRANQNSGYRTYSSNTVSSERAGDWSVEVRSPDGTVLRDEHFVIR